MAIAVRMRNKGASHDAIAAKIGRSAASVSIRMARLRAADYPVMVANDITKWTPERDDRVMALWNNRTPTVDIAEQLGTTPNSILARIVALRRTSPSIEKRRVRVTRVEAEMVVPKHPVDATIVALWNDGIHTAEIAARLGVNPGYIGYRIKAVRRSGIGTFPRWRQSGRPPPSHSLKSSKSALSTQ